MNHLIAIVGLGGVFPGGPFKTTFWNNIVSGRSVSQDVPAGRWSLAPDRVLAPGPAPDKTYSLKGCHVDTAGLDLSGLDIDPEFLSGLDPVHHLLLAAGRQVFHDFKTEKLDLDRTGIILGHIALPTDQTTAITMNTLGRTMAEKYGAFEFIKNLAPYRPINRFVTGLPAGLLARALGLGGGSFTLDAACASSLFALKLAVDELVSGRRDAMLAGGISRPDCLYTQMGFAQLRALSPSGRCAPFDIKSDGLVVGEGAGILALKRLEDAVNHGDHIYGVIRGIGLSNDIKGNLLAPHYEGQLRAMTPAYEQAGWKPWEVDLIEAHGTGTPVGDAVEFDSMGRLWRDAPAGVPKAVLGSVKSNIGHLLTGAGAAGMIKVLLAMQNKILPPMANFETPRPELNLEESPFRILKQGLAWDRRDQGRPRRAAVSAFGFGGINAHVLVEEWRPGENKPLGKALVALKPESQPVAIVALEACFGPWENIDDLADRLLGLGRPISRSSNRGWYGVAQTAWFRDQGLDPAIFQGHFIKDVHIPLGRFRIPPLELKQMLPQQLLMLLVAAGALSKAGFQENQGPATGVFIGLGLDPAAANYHFRWSMENLALALAQKSGLDPESRAYRDWVEALKNAAGPALTADRVIGSLGSITASRIVREFKIGGPGHTVSNEEASGLRALEIGVRALQSHQIDQALVGAVDFAGDIRTLLCNHADRPYSSDGKARPFDPEADGTIPAEGAAALVLKRLDRAVRDGHHIYGLIRGIGSAGGRSKNVLVPAGRTVEKALDRTFKDAGLNPAGVGLFEMHGSGFPGEDRTEGAALAAFSAAHPRTHPGFITSAKADMGHAGAASGLASIIKAVLALDRKIIPPLPQTRTLISELQGLGLTAASQPGFWLHNRADGPRRALVNSMSVDGNCLQALLESYEDPQAESTVRSRPEARLDHGLFALEGDSRPEILDQLSALRQLAANRPENPIHDLARTWWQRQERGTDKGLGLAVIAAGQGELLQALNQAENMVKAITAVTAPGDRVFFLPEPDRQKGDLAFVFPGSGNHFPGMGRDLALAFPEVFVRQESENRYLRDQYVPESFWGDRIDPNLDHRAIIFGQVSLGTAVSDIIRQFGVEPRACLGYSLGESAGLFALKAWRDRDGMLARMKASTLFTHDLAGPCLAARKTWNLSPGEEVQWTAGLVDRPEAEVRKALAGAKRVYLLIVNTPEECVIGGQEKAVADLVKKLEARFWPLQGVSTVHCELVEPVARAYRDMHLFDTYPPAGVRFYSAAWARAYEADRESAADSILAQVQGPMDFPALVEKAHEDGVRCFLEMGPGNSCTRMIKRILGQRPHTARSACVQGQSGLLAVLQVLGLLIARREPLDLSPLYGDRAENRTGPVATAVKTLTCPTDGPGFDSPKPPAAKTASPPDPEPGKPLARGAGRRTPESVAPGLENDLLLAAREIEPLIRQMAETEAQTSRAHAEYLRLADQFTKDYAQNLAWQMDLLAKLTPASIRPYPAQEETVLFPEPKPSRTMEEPLVSPVAENTPAGIPARTGAPSFLDRAKCLEFAVGSIGRVLGPAFELVDSYPTRVRLPDEPLMLVDRIVAVEGRPRSMTSGRVRTEHDVLTNGWYLDSGRIPTCIAIEAGQADLFLSAYLGIDFITRGLAMYRLLDAEVTFHGPLPQPGQVISYDISIERFFRHGDIHLFRFNFDGTVDGRPLLTMRQGCAGFFTPEELAAGRGIVKAELFENTEKKDLPPDWVELVPLKPEAYGDEQILALRRGDLAGCFGPPFDRLSLTRPLTLPAGRMKLIDRVLEFDPHGGPGGLGRIKTEADIHPDDWFLTCHFVDDMVMPGTLMYECCLHTLRIFMLRLGWVGETDESVFEPVSGVASQLKCRGQVVRETRRAAYEVFIKELGFRPEPYALADAIMYADGRAIVEITDMCLQLSGQTREGILGLWSKAWPTPPKEPVLFSRDQILAFARGKPSEVFGPRYKEFDRERFVARLPGPPFSFLDRVVDIKAERFDMTAGGLIKTQFDVRPEAWYFQDNHQVMPYAVLLEAALQSCGFMAAYLGSALTSEVDLHFRNLGGKAMVLARVSPEAGVLTTTVKCTRISKSGGMIIQNYEFSVHGPSGPVLDGHTYFGFFSRDSLAQQVGLQEARLYRPNERETAGGLSLAFPQTPPFPKGKLPMIDRIEIMVPDGGPTGLGYIKGLKTVNPEEWFFKAHFFQDPVWPGSLGLEAFLQLIGVLAAQRWGQGPDIRLTGPAPGVEHEWIYRGQVIPDHREVTVEALVTGVEENEKIIKADGHLAVDGKIIYQMRNFSVKWSNF